MQGQLCRTTRRISACRRIFTRTTKQPCSHGSRVVHLHAPQANRTGGICNSTVTPEHGSDPSIDRPAAPCTTAAILQLAAILSTPEMLQQAWQDVLPACLEAWGLLQQHAVQICQQRKPLNHGADAAEQTACLQQIHEALMQLDALLGTVQQVLLLCGHLKDHHHNQQWRLAATAVFVEAREFEQQLCSDLQLQQMLWMCLQWLQQQDSSVRTPKHQQPRAQSASALPQSTPAAAAAEAAVCSTNSSRRSELVLLAQSLLSHMQLESLNSASLAAPQQQNSADAQVLSMQEQQAIMSGLLAEQKVLVGKMQALLLDPAAAPVVELDADSFHVLMAPLQTRAAAAATASSAVSANADGSGDAGSTDSQLQQAIPPRGNAAADHTPASTDGPSASTDDITQVQLDSKLVSQLLQQHPDAAVRAEVYAAGLLQRLDALLSAWGDLAEVRRKIGRMHGFDSYADFVLQHSLLGSPTAAREFCKRLAEVLQPAADRPVAQLQQQQQQRGKQGPQQDAMSSSIAHLAFKEQDGMLSHHDLQRLQPYLQLSSVLTGLDRVLQLLLGLRLVQRNPQPDEVWADRVLVLELCRKAHGVDADHNAATDSSGTGSSCSNGSSSSSNGSSSSSSSSASGSISSSSGSSSDGCSGQSDAILGTVYLDLNAGYAAQLLLCGHNYTFLACPNSQQQHSKHSCAEGQQGPSSSSSSSSGGSGAGGGGSGAAVALGLQSRGVLHGQHSQVALGLWELCHEMGHAVNFILSSSSSSNPGSSSCHGSSDVQPADCTAPLQEAQQQAAAPAYHLHATWLPVELLELPSTLFETLVMDASTLQLLCRHEDTGDSLPAELAGKLAAFMAATHYSPAFYQPVVLAMLYDLELSSISSRQLGQHAAHHLWSCIMQELSFMPDVEVTLQQVSVVPRLLATHGQGYGYAVAWALAQMLRRPLLQHICDAAAADSMAGAVRPGDEVQGNLSVEHDAGAAQSQRHVAERQEYWQQMLGMGVSGRQTWQLVDLIATLQQGTPQADSALMNKSELAHTLQKRGLWPVVADHDPNQLLSACLVSAFHMCRSTS